MLTCQEVELLATLLQRSGVTQIEAIWANSIMDRLRVAAAKFELEQKKKPEEKETG